MSWRPPLCVVFLRSFPGLLRGLRVTSVWEWRRVEILHHFRQLALDVVFVAQAAIVAASLYRCVEPQASVWCGVTRSLYDMQYGSGF